MPDNEEKKDPEELHVTEQQLEQAIRTMQIAEHEQAVNTTAFNIYGICLN